MHPSLPSLKSIGIVLVGLLLVISCQEDHEVATAERVIFDAESDQPLVQFLSEEKNSINRGFQWHIRKTLNYAKIPYSRLSLTDFNKETPLAASTRVLVVTNTTNLTQNAFRKIVSFVQRGGTLFLPIISENPNYAFLAGLKPNTNYSTDNTAKGFTFTSHFLPGMIGIEYDNKTTHGALLGENFSERIKVLASATNNPDIPTIIENRLGTGAVISINSEQEARKQDRGLYFAAILSGLEQIPYPIVGGAAIFLDDFPAPAYSIKREPILTEFGMDEATFYRKIWWPDMLQLASEEKIKYTSVVCFDYRNLDIPPFLFSEWESSIFESTKGPKIEGDAAMEKVKTQGHELGFHGYNHISLLEKDWENPDFMDIAIQAAEKKWKAYNYGPLPKTYVPPSNEIDSFGLAALSENFPSIRYISSLYLGEFEIGGDREFDPEPYNTHFFNFPRVSSGYVINPGDRFDMQSLYLYTGIWSHFVHPDDVYQIPDSSNVHSRGDYSYRNNESLGWRNSEQSDKALLKNFKNFLASLRKQYPMMRYQQVKDIALQTQQWRNKEFSHILDESGYNVVALNDANRQQQWFVYIKQNNIAKFERDLALKGFKFTKTKIRDGSLFNIITPTSEISIPQSAGTKLLTKQQNQHKLDSLMADYRRFEAGIPEFTSLDEEIDYWVQEGNINKAIILLKRKINSAPKVNTKDYVDLYKYYSWQGQETNFYSFLEEQYQKSPSNALVTISKNIAATNDYPNNSIRKRWMERQMKQYPNDLALKKAYADYFLSETEQVSIALSEAEIKFSQATNTTEKALYLAQLLEANSPLVKAYLESVRPCSLKELQPLAHTIAYYYADQENYSKAIDWADCTAKIEEESLLSWRLETGDYEFLKQRDFKRYIEHMIRFEPWRLTAEMISIEPCSINFDPVTLTTIAYSFADQGSFRSAYYWSQCLPEFDIKEQLQWLAALQAWDEMELRYQEYINSHPSDVDTQLTMAKIYAETGQIFKSWKLAATLPASEGLSSLQNILNQDVQYITPQEQRILLAEYRSFFYPEVASKIERELRINFNDFLVSNSQLLADRLQATTMTHEMGYGFYSKKQHQHIVGLTYNRAYELNFDQALEGNTPISLYGAFYSFKAKERLNKPNFSARVGVETSESKTYFNATTGVTYAKDSLFGSAQLFVKPAVTAPAYNLDIYQLQLTLYQELQFAKRLQLTAAFEGNYYTDNVTVGTLTGNLGYKYHLNPRNRLLPFVETAASLGNADYSLGYPYWAIEERLYGGGGLAYRYQFPKKEISFEADAAHFFDTFSGSFQRFRTTTNLPVFPYFYMNFNAEFYTIENFYSNNFRLGLKYHF